MPVVVIGLSHRTSPVSVREKFACADAALPAVLEEMRRTEGVEEVVLVSTCNRVEVYAVVCEAVSSACDAIRANLIRRAGVEPSNGELYTFAEPSSIEHLFRVVSGLDSMVLGETEILGQVKKSYDTALTLKHTGAGLNKVFQTAFNVAKLIRTETCIQRGNVSVASVAVDLAEKIFSSLNHRQVLVIGAGETGEKTARALMSRGVKDILVTNRSLERAETLAAELSGRAVPFDGWAGEFEKVDIVISSTSAPGYILSRDNLQPLMKLRRNRPLLLVDIAVPRDIDPAVNEMDDVFLYNIDDLQLMADDCLRSRQKEASRCEEMIREKTSRFIEGRRMAEQRRRQENKG